MQKKSLFSTQKVDATTGYLKFYFHIFPKNDTIHMIEYFLINKALLNSYERGDCKDLILLCFNFKLHLHPLK